MEERPNHQTVVIGASSIAEELRRSLVQHGVSHAGVTTHLRGLRRTMVLPMEEDELVVVCVSLDRTTLDRHGNSIRSLLSDHYGSQRGIRSIGLLTESGFTRDVAELGCDVYVEDSVQAMCAIRMLARKWRTTRRRQAAFEGLSRSKRMKESLRTDLWTWGIESLPSQLEPLHSTKPSRRSETARNEDGQPDRNRPESLD